MAVSRLGMPYATGTGGSVRREAWWRREFFFHCVCLASLFFSLFFLRFRFSFFLFYIFFFRLTWADGLLTGLAGWDGGEVILIRGPKSFFLFFLEKIYLLNLFFLGPGCRTPLGPHLSLSLNNMNYELCTHAVKETSNYNQVYLLRPQ